MNIVYVFSKNFSVVLICRNGEGFVSQTTSQKDQKNKNEKWENKKTRKSEFRGKKKIDEDIFFLLCDSVCILEYPFKREEKNDNDINLIKILSVFIYLSNLTL